MFLPPRGPSQFRQDKHHLSSMNLWHLSPSSINDSSSTISSLLICSGCEADLANFCNSGGHLHSHVYSYTLRLLGGDQVSISFNKIIIFVKLNFSPRDKLVSEKYPQTNGLCGSRREMEARPRIVLGLPANKLKLQVSCLSISSFYIYMYFYIISLNLFTQPL